MWAMILAVAGAIKTTSASSASETCSMENSDSSRHILVTTGRPVMARNESGVMNRVADSVITTLTSTPCCTSLLAISAAL